MEIQTEGLNHLEWAKARKRALLEQELDPHLWERMSKQQRWFMQQLRLAFDSIET